MRAGTLVLLAVPSLLNALSEHDQVLRVQYQLQDKEAVAGPEREAANDEISRFCRPTPVGEGPSTGLVSLICNSILGKEEITAPHSVTASGKEEGISPGHPEESFVREVRPDYQHNLRDKRAAKKSKQGLLHLICPADLFNCSGILCFLCGAWVVHK